MWARGRETGFLTMPGGVLTGEAEGVSDPKLQRIKEIEVAGLEVAHVIHRHGIDTSRTAYEIEAALIDAYPGLTNKVKGRGSKDHGSRHVEEIIDEYAGEEFEVGEPLMVISIGRTFYEFSNVYDAVRCCWKVNVDKADRYNLVLASVRGLIMGAYRPEKWLPATKANFPDLEEGAPVRWGFVGETAEAAVWNLYVRKRVPEQYRGSQSPIRYCDPG